MFFLNILIKKNNTAFLLNKRFSSTIFALCSGEGKAGVSVFRVSGKNARDVILKMTKNNVLKKNLNKKQMCLSSIYHPNNLDPIDKGLVLWFPGPNSFTGEDVCEVQVHGGKAIKTSLLESLEKLKGFRMARNGEFSKRAFMNKKLDLSQLEGLRDLLEADTEAQRKQALRLFTGEVARVTQKWKQQLIKIRTWLEVVIDFGEEENIGEGILRNVNREIEELKKDLKKYLVRQRGGVYEKIKQGLNMVVIGEPNAGKSSFINNLCGRDVSIVSSLEGTTRDLIETTLTFQGQIINVKDTAGLRKNNYNINAKDDIGLIEKIGMKKTIDSLKSADVVVLVVDTLKHLQSLKTHFYKIHLNNKQNIDNNFKNNTNNILKKKKISNKINNYFYSNETNHNIKDIIINNDHRFLYEFCFDHLKSLTLDLDSLIKEGKSLIVVMNKIDLVEKEKEKNTIKKKNKKMNESKFDFLSSSSFSTETISSVPSPASPSISSCFLSCLDSDSLGSFLIQLKKTIYRIVYDEGGETEKLRVVLNQRHLQVLTSLLKILNDTLVIIESQDHLTNVLDLRLELVADKMREALFQMEILVGKVDVEQILDQIFKEFCIGK